MEDKFNYETLKILAKQRKQSVKELLALSSNNDPFYTGIKHQIVAAEWFMEIWNRFNYSNGVHLRRIHYQIISQSPLIKLPHTINYKTKNKDGSKTQCSTDVYINEDPCFSYLDDAAQFARYLGMVNPEAFIDRKAHEPIINTHWDNWNIPDPTISVEETEYYNYVLPEIPTLDNIPDRLPDLPSLQANGYDGLQQDYHLEVWIEKSTMDDVLVPICRKYGVNLIRGAGELSLTAAISFLKRVRDSERPARILYISDFDGKGVHMPISVSRKIEFYQRNRGFGDLDIGLQPIVLTQEQVQKYNLPRMPMKAGDNTKPGFEDAYGNEGAVELDALEALYPGELAKIVTNEILRYYDADLLQNAQDTENELQEHLHNVSGRIQTEYSDELHKIDADYKDFMGDFEKTRQEFNELAKTFQPKLDAYHARHSEIMERTKEVYTRFEDELNNVNIDLDEYPLPEATTEDNIDDMLYNSDRDYFEQLEVYKAHKNGE